MSEPDSAEPESSDDHERLVVELCVECDDAAPWADWLVDQVARIAELAGVTRGRLGLAIVDDAQMTQLHMDYQGIDGTTDVLTFDLRDDADDAEATLDGDVALCLDEATRQAAERGHRVQDELLLYAVHGLLHLLGYDDHAPADAARMHQREDELLTAAGIGAIYDRPAV